MPNQPQYGNDQLSNAQEFFRERAQVRREKDASLFRAAAYGLIGAYAAKKLFGNRGS